MKSPRMKAERASTDLVEAIRDFVEPYSIETTPREGARVQNYADLVGRGRRMYIAHIAGTPYNELIALAARLRQEGLEPVMHVTARDMPSKAALNDVIARYAGEAGGQQVLLIAGDMPHPTGEFADTISVLRTGILEKHGIKSISLAGHPEGSKAIGDVRLRQAIIDKNAYAKETSAKLTLVTQFGFEAEPFIAWEKAMREDGINSLPIHVGVAGLASFPTLLRFAVECGAGASIRALKSRAGSLAKLATVAQPDDLVLDLARHKQKHPESLIQSLHFFPFGGVKKTAEWLSAIADGRIALNADASGFSVR